MDSAIHLSYNRPQKDKSKVNKEVHIKHRHEKRICTLLLVAGQQRPINSASGDLQSVISSSTGVSTLKQRPSQLNFA